MSARCRHILLVLIAQGACLAVGLRMYQHHVQSTAVQAVHARAWAELEENAARLFAEPPSLEVIVPDSGAPAVGRLLRVLPAHPLSVEDILITDRHWRIVFPFDASDEPGGQGDALPQVVEWVSIFSPESHRQPGSTLSPRPDASADTGRDAPASPSVDQGSALVRRGRILIPDGEHVAVAHALKDDQGHLIVHRSTGEIHAEAASLTHLLPVLTGLTFAWTAALVGLIAYLILARLHDEIDRARSRSTTDTLRQTQSLVRTRDTVIFGLARLAESRDSETGEHLERICVYATTLASAARRDPRFADEISPSFVRLIGLSSALHDIGKVGVEDRVLRKRGALTAAERTRMESHTIIGAECLREIEQRLGGSNFLQMATQIAIAHHERWDGTGYPNGLAGKNIPLAARIVAVADVYDALASRRVYKEALSHEQCLALIRGEAGKQLDPDLVDVWLTVEHKFRDIARQLDEETSEDGLEAASRRPVPVTVGNGAAAFRIAPAV